MSEAFFYLDRPAVPATRQELINLEAITETSVEGTTAEIDGNFAFYATVVKDELGATEGVLLFLPDVSYEELVTPGDLAKIDDESEEPTDNAKDDDDNIDESIWEHLSEDERLIVQEARGVLLHKDLPLGDKFALQDLIDLTLQLARRNRIQYEMLSAIEDEKKWAAYADEAQDESDGIV